MPVVYGEREIPGFIKTEDAAIEYTFSVAKVYKSLLWLVISKKENVRIDKDGSVKPRNEVTIEHLWLPFTRI